MFRYNVVVVHSRIELDISTPLDKTTTLSGVMSKNGKPRLHRWVHLKLLVLNVCSFQSKHGIGVTTSVLRLSFVGNEMSVLHSVPSELLFECEISGFLSGVSERFPLQGSYATFWRLFSTRCVQSHKNEGLGKSNI